MIGALISTLLLSIGMAALYKMYINNAANSVYIQHASMALAYAREKIETLRFKDSVTEGTGNEELQNQGVLYRRVWHTKTSSESGYRQCSISIRWQDSSGDHSLELNTLIDGQSVYDLPLGQ